MQIHSNFEGTALLRYILWVGNAVLLARFA